MKITERNFISQMKEQNEKALEYVIDTYGWVIKTVVKKQLVHMDNYQQECINDVLYAIWNNIDHYNPDKSTFQSWVAAIARYRSIDYIRKYINQIESESWEEIEATDTLNVEAAVLQNQISEEVEKMLACLNKRDREIFLRLYVKEETVEQVSSSMGISKDVLYNRTSRGKLKIRSLYPSFERSKRNE